MKKPHYFSQLPIQPADSIALYEDEMRKALEDDPYIGLDVHNDHFHDCYNAQQMGLPLGEYHVVMRISKSTIA